MLSAGAAPGAPRGRRRAAGGALLLAALVLAVFWSPAGEAAAQDDGPVHVVEIRGPIDLGVAPYLDRTLQAAEDAGATVVLVVDTPGGRLDAVLQMRGALLDTTVPTVAFVEELALSAGALITLAAEEIHLAPQAVFGAATPVLGSGDPAGEKTISAVRATFRATAEVRGRDPRVAEAMVDPDVAVPGLADRGQLLTLSTPQAREHGYADAVVDDLQASLAAAGLADRALVRTGPTPAERGVRWLTSPVVASLLLTLGVWLLIGDFLGGGLGIASVLGLTLLGTFFWGHLLAGLAGWEDVALVVLGLVLLAVELLVVPGVGVAGVLGLAALFGGAFLAMLSRDLVTGAQLQRAGVSVGVSFLLIVAATVGLVVYLSRRGGRRGLVLRSQVDLATPAVARAPSGWLRWFGAGEALPAEQAAGGAEPAEAESGDAGRESGGSLLGATGVALTDLRPAGTVDLDGRRVDVVTEGGYVDAGEAVEVVDDRAYRKVVRRRTDVQ